MMDTLPAHSQSLCKPSSAALHTLRSSESSVVRYLASLTGAQKGCSALYMPEGSLHPSSSLVGPCASCNGKWHKIQAWGGHCPRRNTTGGQRCGSEIVEGSADLGDTCWRKQDKVRAKQQASSVTCVGSNAHLLAHGFRFHVILMHHNPDAALGQCWDAFELLNICARWCTTKSRLQQCDSASQRDFRL